LSFPPGPCLSFFSPPCFFQFAEPGYLRSSCSFLFFCCYSRFLCVSSRLPPRGSFIFPSCSPLISDAFFVLLRRVCPFFLREVPRLCALLRSCASFETGRRSNQPSLPFSRSFPALHPKALNVGPSHYPGYPPFLSLSGAGRSFSHVSVSSLFPRFSLVNGRRLVYPRISWRSPFPRLRLKGVTFSILCSVPFLFLFFFYAP